MPKLTELLDEVIHELSAPYDADGFWVVPDDYLPNFVVTRSGPECHFTRRAQSGLDLLAAHLLASRPDFLAVMRQDQFCQLVRSSIADLYVEGVLATGSAKGLGQLRLLEQELEERQRSLLLPFGHAFPATTLGIEETGTFCVGPVEIAGVKSWLDSISLSEGCLTRFGIDADADWRSELRSVLESGELRGFRPDSPPHLEELVDALYGCHAVISVAVLGLEQNFSREIARMAARTALDGVSLLARSGPNAFSQQALSDERLQPPKAHSAIVFKGEHWIGGAWTDRAIPFRRPGVRSRVFGDERTYHALCDVVGCLIDGRCHKHPQLAMRWAAALEWYAEGCRETSATLAIPKLVNRPGYRGGPLV